MTQHPVVMRHIEDMQKFSNDFKLFRPSKLKYNSHSTFGGQSFGRVQLALTLAASYWHDRILHISNSDGDSHGPESKRMRLGGASLIAMHAHVPRRLMHTSAWA